jgi:tetrahydromethanopterin S-methyltransferase subunit F
MRSPFTTSLIVAGSEQRMGGMGERRTARIFGVVLGLIFAGVLVLNALANF